MFRSISKKFHKSVILMTIHCQQCIFYLPIESHIRHMIQITILFNINYFGLNRIRKVLKLYLDQFGPDIKIQNCQLVKIGYEYKLFPVKME